jgi:hypothetical protein
MQKPTWRKVRSKSDVEHNERVTEQLLNDPMADDFAVALDQCGYMIVSRDGAVTWPMVNASPLTPSWTVPVREQELAITRGLAQSYPGGTGRRREVA